MLDLFTSKERLDAEEIFRLIKDKLRHDADILATTLTVSLKCPIGKTVLMDALTLFKFNACRRPSLRMCPLCGKFSPFNTLKMDEYFANILRSTSSDQVIIHQDGSWLQKKPPPTYRHSTRLYS